MATHINSRWLKLPLIPEKTVIRIATSVLPN